MGIIEQYRLPRTMQTILRPQMTLHRFLTSLWQPDLFLKLLLSIPLTWRRSPTPWLRDYPNSGYWKETKMDWKRGGPSRHSWATFNSLKILYTCNCKSMVHSLRSSSDLIISYRAVSSSASSSWTLECALWTTSFGHPGSHLHPPIMLGTICTPSFSRCSYFAILASIPYSPPASPSRLLLGQSTPTPWEPTSASSFPEPPRSSLSNHADMSDSSFSPPSGISSGQRKRLPSWYIVAPFWSTSLMNLWSLRIPCCLMIFF